jgi:hypothetical protein
LTIPRLIDFETPSEAAISMHEAGHAVAALMAGVVPAFVEITGDASLPGPARNRILTTSQAEREAIACGAFAVEYWLFRDNRLVNAADEPVPERRFVQIALGSNAHEDKIRFFGANLEQPDGTWPEYCDRAFMNRGIELSSQLIKPLVTELAEALIIERRLECRRIIEIGAKHMPDRAAAWTCGDDGEDNA